MLIFIRLSKITLIKAVTLPVNPSIIRDALLVRTVHTVFKSIAKYQYVPTVMVVSFFYFTVRSMTLQVVHVQVRSFIFVACINYSM